MAKTKVTKVSVEEEFSTLKKHFGGIVATVKALMEKVESLEKKLVPKETDEIKELLDKQKVIEEGIATNETALSRIDKEIENLAHKVNASNDRKETLRSTGVGIKMCRYYNGGYCKYKGNCKFGHSEDICKKHLENGACGDRGCTSRHPKRCNKSGCTRPNCAYLHDTHANNKVFKCEGCQDVWDDRTHVIENIINNQVVYFCLNCNEWIKDKIRVFDEGWTLLDTDGYLRQGI